MFEYEDLNSYIDGIRKELILSGWHYTEEQANKLIAKRISWIKDSFEERESAWSAAMDVGYCCG